jgi:four helix bundle protein
LGYGGSKVLVSVASYKDLRVWQESVELSVEVYALTSKFPSDEKFGLISQLRRASVSVASNIAEGHARHSTGDYLRFLAISMGSIAEIQTQLTIAQKLTFCTAQQQLDLATRFDTLGGQIRALQISLRRHQD